MKSPTFFEFFFSLLFLIESEPISTSYTSVFRETRDDVILENKTSHDDMINESINLKILCFYIPHKIVFLNHIISHLSHPPSSPPLPTIFMNTTTQRQHETISK